MKVSTSFIHGYAVTDWDELATYAIEAERIGVDSIWAPEAWGFDGATPLAYLAAKTSKIRLGTSILQIGGRTPANLAMTAMSLYSMSKGRFILGIGTSGPQVMEGWHGVTFDKPIKRTRETIEILRKIFSGERLTYQGEFYQIPVREGQGKPLSTFGQPMPDLPIYVASMGPANLRLTGELANGWRGTSFMPEHADVFLKPLAEGAKLSGRTLKDLELHTPGTVCITDDVDEAVEALRAPMAYSLGAMGSRRNNFYNNAYSRAGYKDIAKEVQRLWLDRKHDEARMMIPDEMVMRTHLIGTPDMIKERIRLYRDVGVDSISATIRQVRDPGTKTTVAGRIQTMGEFMDLVNEVNVET